MEWSGDDFLRDLPPIRRSVILTIQSSEDFAMRMVYACGCVLAFAGVLQAQETATSKLTPRYGTLAHLREFPQATPKDALASVISTIGEGRIDYLLAQLTDPEFVDSRVKQVYNGRFDGLVNETRRKIGDNPAAIAELRRFARDGEWQIAETTASVQLKDVPERRIFLKKIGERWYFENRQTQ
jgi:hypothetical protein